MAKTISLVLTERIPESQLTVFELVALGRQPYTNWMDRLTKEDLEKIQWAMKETHIEEFQDHLFHELSNQCRCGSRINLIFRQQDQFITHFGGEINFMSRDDNGFFCGDGQLM